jgi:hypothetical protein
MENTESKGKVLKMYDYFVDPDRKILIRLSATEAEQYCPGAPEVWQEDPELEGIRFGSGDFDSFMRIDAQTAREYAAKFLALKEAGFFID